MFSLPLGAEPKTCPFHHCVQVGTPALIYHMVRIAHMVRP